MVHEQTFLLIGRRYHKCGCNMSRCHSCFGYDLLKNQQQVLCLWPHPLSWQCDFISELSCNPKHLNVFISPLLDQPDFNSLKYFKFYRFYLEIMFCCFNIWQYNANFYLFLCYSWCHWQIKNAQIFYMLLWGLVKPEVLNIILFFVPIYKNGFCLVQ